MKEAQPKTNDPAIGMKRSYKDGRPYPKKISPHCLYSTAAQQLRYGAPKAPSHQAKGDYGCVKEYMSWFIRKEMKDKNIAGRFIALVDDQKIVWIHTD